MAIRIMWCALLSLIILSAGCKKDESTAGVEGYDYFIFGTYKGKCVGDCVRYYKIEGNQVYEDNMLSGTSVLNFNTAPMAADKYNLAIRVPKNLPLTLLNLPDKVSGCPDCNDQGGYIVRMVKDGASYNWRFDTNNTANDADFRTFVSSLSTTLSTIQ